VRFPPAEAAVAEACDRRLELRQAEPVPRLDQRDDVEERRPRKIAHAQLADR
jgi:hypothetical protein